MYRRTSRRSVPSIRRFYCIGRRATRSIFWIFCTITRRRLTDRRHRSASITIAPNKWRISNRLSPRPCGSVQRPMIPPRGCILQSIAGRIFQRRFAIICGCARGAFRSKVRGISACCSGSTAFIMPPSAAARAILLRCGTRQTN